MIRLSISRPTLSVPSGYVGLPPGAHIGGFKRAARLPLIGSWGATHSAKRLGITSRNTRMASARPGNRLTWKMARKNRRGMMYQGGRCGIAIAIGLIPFSYRLYVPELLIPDTRVNVRIENIHHQVSHGE